MGNANPLLELRDIHLPDAISFFPIASGWWAVAGFCLALAGVLSIIYKKLRTPMMKRQALKELNALSLIYSKDGNVRKLAVEISILLKRVALVLYGNEKVAGLHGGEWQNFLLDTGHDMTFTDREGELLALAPYVSEESFKSDKCGEKLITAAENWIKHNSLDSL